MGFGSDLWCPQAHAAVVKLLDSELHLMEVMKKWMGQRAKSERDFSAQLHHMTGVVEKMERSQHSAGPDYISQLNKVSGRTTGFQVGDTLVTAQCHLAGDTWLVHTIGGKIVSLIGLSIQGELITQ